MVLPLRCRNESSPLEQTSWSSDRRVVEISLNPSHGGFMRLRGRMCSAFFTLNLEGDDVYFAQKCSLKFKSSGSATRTHYTFINESGDHENQAAFCMELEAGGSHLTPYKKGGCEDANQWKQWRSGRPESRGLLLRPTGQRKGEFKRLGYYESCGIIFSIRRAGEIFDGWRDHLSMQAAFRRRNISSEFYEDLDDAGRYTIRIV